MSDYLHRKAIFYPIDKEQYEMFEDDPVKFPNIDEKGEFITEVMISPGYKNYYHFLIYILYTSYGEAGGDFGSNRTLTAEEKEYWTAKFKDTLNMLGVTINPDLFKYVDYCYYNCSESDDYYHGGVNSDNTIEMDKQK